MYFFLLFCFMKNDTTKNWSPIQIAYICLTIFNHKACFTSNLIVTEAFYWDRSQICSCNQAVPSNEAQQYQAMRTKQYQAMRIKFQCPAHINCRWLQMGFELMLKYTKAEGKQVSSMPSIHLTVYKSFTLHSVTQKVVLILLIYS